MSEQQAHAETQRRGEQKEQTEWQKITGMNSYSELLPKEERRAAIRKLVKAVEELARIELEAHREDDPRTVFWDPMPEICVYLQIARGQLSRFTKELTGLAAHELVDRIRAEKLKGQLREQLRPFVQAHKNYDASGRGRNEARHVQLWRVLKESRQTPEYSRDSSAMELGFANYRRLYRACLLVYRMTPIQLELALIRELLEEHRSQNPELSENATTSIEKTCGNEPPKVQNLQRIDAPEMKRSGNAPEGIAA